MGSPTGPSVPGGAASLRNTPITRCTSPDGHVKVDLGSARETVRIYDPTVGTAPIRKLAGARSVPLTLSDHPVVIEILDRR